VWEKTLGLSSTYFAMNLHLFFDELRKVREMKDAKFQAVVHPGRSVKFFGFLMLASLPESARLGEQEEAESCLSFIII
jgi:hypothetical protein